MERGHGEEPVQPRNRSQVHVMNYACVLTSSHMNLRTEGPRARCSSRGRYTIFAICHHCSYFKRCQQYRIGLGRGESLGHFKSYRSGRTTLFSAKVLMTRERFEIYMWHDFCNQPLDHHVKTTRSVAFHLLFAEFFARVEKIVILKMVTASVSLDLYE